MEGRRIPTVAANDNDAYRFYVYAWQYPDGRPFYVGKGSGGRDTQPKYTNSIFNRVVAKIRRNGGEPLVVRWQERLSESDAHRLERAYIRLFGRRDNGTGILTNMTDGGEGTSGWVPSEEWRAKRSKANKGRSHTAEARAKISETVRKRMDEGARARIGDLHRGKVLSEERREKMADAKRFARPIGKHKGVSLIASSGRWRATIWIRGKNRYLGSFSAPDEAAKAYDVAAIETWGLGNCYLNFPNLHIA